MSDFDNNKNNNNNNNNDDQILIKNRAIGAIMGVLIGDALGMGYQWYYEKDLKDKEIGEWIENYIDPKTDGTNSFAYISKFRYENGLRAGDVTQNGQIFIQLLHSIANYDIEHFFNEFEKFISNLNGESLNGRYTEQFVLEIRKNRILNNIEWNDKDLMGSHVTTAEGAIFSVIFAAMYSDPLELCQVANDFLSHLFADVFIRGNYLVFALAVQAFINGITINEFGNYMKSLAFNTDIKSICGNAFDNFLTPGYGSVANIPDLNSFEPKFISMFYGLDCQFTHIVPCCYYLIYRIPENFEECICSATNGLGQNVTRGSLTGALSGALNGLNNIPERYLNGLLEKNGDSILKNAKKIADLRFK